MDPSQCPTATEYAAQRWTGTYPSGNGGMDAPIGFSGGVKPVGAAAGPEGIDAWFSVEPAGALALHINFGKYISASQRTCIDTSVI